MHTLGISPRLHLTVNINTSNNPYVKTHSDVVVKGIVRFPNTLISSSRSTQVDAMQNEAIKLNLRR